MTGKVIKLQTGKDLDEATQAKMRRFLENELTWAEVEGMTAAQARQIARIGCELAVAGRLDDARIIFEGLVAGNPKDTTAQAALGTIYQRQQRKAEALECFDKSLAVWPANVIALAHRGELRLRTGDAGGLEDLAKAVEADPKGVSPAGRRARTILVALAKVKQASQEKARAVAQR